jgi:PKHD-type hydroxylase
MQFVKHDISLVTCDELFTTDEISQIKNYVDSIVHTQTFDETTINRENTLETRIFRSPETNFIFKKMSELVKNVNDEHFDFDIEGYDNDAMFHTTYIAPTKLYDWHTDKVFRDGEKHLSKLSVVVQLSDPSEYEGGVAQVAMNGVNKIERKCGLVYIIPGSAAHSLTAITSGVRRVLVAFMVGPPFK